MTSILKLIYDKKFDIFIHNPRREQGVNGFVSLKIEDLKIRKSLLISGEKDQKIRVEAYKKEKFSKEILNSFYMASLKKTHSFRGGKFNSISSEDEFVLKKGISDYNNGFVSKQEMYKKLGLDMGEEILKMNKENKLIYPKLSSIFPAKKNDNKIEKRINCSKDRFKLLDL